MAPKDPKTQYFLGVDVGGTNIKCGIVSGAEKILLSDPIKTAVVRKRSSNETVAAIQKTIEVTLTACQLKRKQISAGGVAWPGRVDVENGIVVEHINLNKTDKFPSQREMTDILKLPIVYENDGNAAALAEYWLGTGKEVNSLALFTIGTGIGGGIIINGKIHRGLNSLGGELGHVAINVQHGKGSSVPTCNCGRKACLEAYASCNALNRRANEGLKSGIETTLNKHWKKTPPIERARLIDNLRKEGDEFCSKLLRETAGFLAEGAANIMNILAPELVCFGGGMSKAGDEFIDWIREDVDKILPLLKDTKITKAALGNSAGYIGAAGCAREFFLTLQ